jgi:hypothetical protein
MNRRCTSESCLVEASRTVSLDLPLATVLSGPREWSRVAYGNARVARDIEVDWGEFCQDRYLFSHCTIVSSLEVETDENKQGAGYYIKPECSKLVNNNGNGWSNPVLLATFNTFRGAENYLEHVQIPELSKGKILDVVVRPVKWEDQGRTSNIYYADILVATNRKHNRLVRRITSGEVNAMSMGCLAHWVQCSRCGKVFGDNDPDCHHIKYGMLQPFVDQNGIQRMTAELCGRLLVDQNTGKLARDENGNLVGDPKSCRFIEASWVERPAFGGAVLNHFLSDVPKAAAQVLRMDTPNLEAVMDDIFKMRVADSRGMMVLRVARAEWIRRKRAAMMQRVANGFIKEVS